MTVRSQMRGHPVYHDGTVWRHADDHTLAPASGGAERPCTACGLIAEDGYGPDPCLGWLDGVDGACCGHGTERSKQRWAWGPLLVCAATVVMALVWIGVL